MGRKSQIPALEEKIGKPIYNYLAEAIKAKKPPEIANDLAISLSTFYDIIKKVGLKEKLKEASTSAIYSKSGGELKAVIDEFLRAKTIGERSEQTIRSYHDILYCLLWWLDDQGKPSTLGVFNKEVLTDFFYYLKTSINRFGGKSSSSRRPMMASSIAGYRRVLRALGYWLMRQDKIEKNPVIQIDAPKVPKRLPEDLPDEMILKILNSFKNDFEGIRDKTIIMMFIDTGLRLDGLVNLEADNFNLNTSFASIIEKGNKERKIHITLNMLAQLKKYLELRAPLAKTDKLWITPEGIHFKRESLRQMVSQLNELTPGYRIHPHLFRHVWAKFLMQSNINPLKAQLMGGWADVKLFLHYASAYSGEAAWEGHDEASAITKLMKGVAK